MLRAPSVWLFLRKARILKNRKEDDFLSYRIMIALILAACSLPVLLCGCASIGSGRTASVEEAAPVHLQLMGKDKEGIIKILGDPDFIAFEKEKEFWGYHKNKRWYFDLHYLSGGRAEAKDLVVQLTNGRAKDVYLIDKGSSVGILAVPLSVPD